MSSWNGYRSSSSSSSSSSRSRVASRASCLAQGPTTLSVLAANTGAADTSRESFERRCGTRCACSALTKYFTRDHGVWVVSKHSNALRRYAKELKAGLEFYLSRRLGTPEATARGILRPAFNCGHPQKAGEFELEASPSSLRGLMNRPFQRRSFTSTPGLQIDAKLITR